MPYTVPNLHRMARELNIKRCWYHGGANPHYDIPKLRVREIMRKCEVVSSREILLVIKQAKKNPAIAGLFNYIRSPSS